MPLQQLVEYFNDRFEQEHHTGFRPFILKEGKVSGLFGPIQVSSVFTPLRHVSNPAGIAGHAAKLAVATHDFHHARMVEIDSTLNPDCKDPADFDSIINLDRLTRTVHMLNYLPCAHDESVLFLEVDPRHILGIKRDHGAYFEDVITRCGLATSNVVISMTVSSVYARHHDHLLDGLNNYRRRGYRIALNIGNLYPANSVLELTEKLSPDYLRVNAPRQNQAARHLPRALDGLKRLLDKLGAQAIMQIERREQAFIAQLAQFDLVEGGYDESLPEQDRFTAESVNSAPVYDCAWGSADLTSDSAA